jgi:hypothetical protein
MKLSTWIIFLAAISGIFYVFASMTNEANIQYPEAGINNSEWATKYDMTQRLEWLVIPLRDKFANITDVDVGFFTKVVAGITAIPYAIILIPSAMFSGLGIFTDIITGFFSALGIPPTLILLVGLIALLWIVFKLASFFQRGEI